MKTNRWQNLTLVADLFRAPPLDLFQHLRRLKAVEGDVILPIKLAFVAMLVAVFFSGPWSGDIGILALDVVQSFVIVYALLNLVVAALLLTLRRWPFRLVYWLVFCVSFVDGVFVGALTLVTGGLDSVLYWLFLALIVRNAVSNPLATPQIILNVSVVVSYAIASGLDIFIASLDTAQFNEVTRRGLDLGLPENPTETFLLRVMILILLGACCYGLQVVLERERRAGEESRESASRQEQLRAAGRLAAEIAHKIKNPLGIINNAAFSIQRALENKTQPTLQQAKIIREEVDRADRIITELMGYAQLAEGQVERLSVVREVNRAIMTVFPAGARYSIQLHTDFADNLPPFLMQRNHFSEIMVNILQNAREILAGIGEIHVRAWSKDDSVFISVRDDGPGIPADKLERIFEPYFSTKDRGTGLGLAIARHNVEMYQGRLRAVSESGQGAEFILELPTRTFMKKRK